jgi:ubiquinone/menaquinone biosynthesis C-methylase UbiE
MRNKRPRQNKRIYNPKTYESFNLWLDYWVQFELIREVNPKSVLEIGKGIGTLEFLLKRQGYRYTSADIEKALKPDLIADITKLPLKSKSYDVVCAFQVLEHISYNEFETALKEMKRVARKAVIVSLPYSTFYFSFAFSFFYAKKIEWLFKLFGMKPLTPKYFSIKIPTFFLNTFGMIPTHAWEMGRKNYSKKRINNSIKNAGLKIIKEKERIFYPYHQFYVLKP